MVTNIETKYFEGIGRRKSATARVRIVASNKENFIINERPIDDYFKIESQALNARKAILGDFAGSYSVSVHVSGGGPSAQSDAVRLGLARAVIKHKPDARVAVKKAKLLKRDSREVERKMFGKKKSRKSSQWSKR